MSAETIMLDEAAPEQAFERCREVIRRGGIVIYPTDTFYALGADPRNADAVRRLFQIKGRSFDQPILLLIGDENDVPQWAANVRPEAKRLMSRHWPGPLTLVFEARADVPALLTAGSGTIGLRMPGNVLTRRLLAFIGTALTGTSANITGSPSPGTAAGSSIGDRVDLILDAGSTHRGKPSTIVDVTGEQLRIIREGAVSLQDRCISGRAQGQ